MTRAAFAIILLVGLVNGCGVENKSDGGQSIPPVFSVSVTDSSMRFDGETVGGFARIAWGRQLSDGTLVVGDRRLAELSFFPRHQPPFVAARRGPGPGELEAVVDGGVLRADSVINSGMHLSVFGGEGAFARALPVPIPSRSHQFLGLLKDSILVFKVFEGELKPGLAIDTATFVTQSSASGVVRHLFQLPDRWSYFTNRGSRQDFLWTFPPFFGRSVSGVLDSLVVWGTGQVPFLFFLDETGKKLDSIPVAFPRKRLLPWEVARVKEERLDRTGDNVEQRRAFEMMFDEVDFPDFHSFFDKLLIGSNGLLWLRAPVENPDDTVEWWAHDETGQLRQKVLAPARFDILQFLDTTAVAIETTDLGVEYITVLSFVRSDLPSR